MIKALICFVLMLLPWACAWMGGVVSPKGGESTIVNRVPVVRGYVTDYAGVLSDTDKEYLRQLCVQLEQRTSVELAVVTVKHMSGDGVSDDKALYPTVEVYANELFNKNGLGKKDKNDGVLFLVSTGERKTRIEVGYGLEGVLPDGKCGRILDTYAVPYFKNDKYAEGIKKTSEAIVKTLGGTIPLEEVTEKKTINTQRENKLVSTQKGDKSDSIQKSFDGVADDGYNLHIVIPGLLLGLLLPRGILIIVWGFLTMSFILITMFGLVEHYSDIGNTMIYVWLVLTLASGLRLRGGYGGSSSGGSSGGGGASRGF